MPFSVVYISLKSANHCGGLSTIRKVFERLISLLCPIDFILSVIIRVIRKISVQLSPLDIPHPAQQQMIDYNPGSSHQQ